MQFRKFGMALALSASFGLLACGDDSSSGKSSPTAGDDEVTTSCTIQKDPFKKIYKIDGYGTAETSLTYKDGKITITTVSKMTSQAYADKVCKESKEDEDLTSVKCDGKTVTVTETEKGEKEDLEFFKKSLEQSCKEESGKKITSSSSTKKSSSSSATKTDKSDFTLIEYEGGYYRGHGCDFKMSDKTWEFAYEEKYGSIIAKTKVVCEDLDDEDYSYADKICTKTVTYDDEEIYEECQEEKTENFETICKDGLSIEKYFDRDNTEDLFISTMKFCQRINLNPDWEYKPESSSSKEKSSSSAKAKSSSSEKAKSSSSEKAKSSSSSKQDILKGCDEINPEDDDWVFTIENSGMTLVYTYHWISESSYEVGYTIKGMDYATDTEVIENAERESTYLGACALLNSFK